MSAQPQSREKSPEVLDEFAALAALKAAEKRSSDHSASLEQVEAFVRGDTVAILTPRDMPTEGERRDIHPLMVPVKGGMTVRYYHNPNPRPEDSDMAAALHALEHDNITGKGPLAEFNERTQRYRIMEAGTEFLATRLPELEEVHDHAQHKLRAKPAQKGPDEITPYDIKTAHDFILMYLFDKGKDRKHTAQQPVGTVRRAGISGTVTFYVPAGDKPYKQPLQEKGTDATRRYKLARPIEGAAFDKVLEELLQPIPPATKPLVERNLAGNLQITDAGQTHVTDNNLHMTTFTEDSRFRVPPAAERNGTARVHGAYK